MKRIKYEAKLNDGSTVETWGYLPKTKGLIVNREIRWGEVQDSWVVSHKESTLVVGRHFRTKRDAEEYADALDGVLDWEKSADELDKPENSAKVRKIYNEFNPVTAVRDRANRF